MQVLIGEVQPRLDVGEQVEKILAQLLQRLGDAAGQVGESLPELLTANGSIPPAPPPPALGRACPPGSPQRKLARLSRASASAGEPPANPRAAAPKGVMQLRHFLSGISARGPPDVQFGRQRGRQFRQKHDSRVKARRSSARRQCPRGILQATLRAAGPLEHHDRATAAPTRRRVRRSCPGGLAACCQGTVNADGDTGTFSVLAIARISSSSLSTTLRSDVTHARHASSRRYLMLTAPPRGTSAEPE